MDYDRKQLDNDRQERVRDQRRQMMSERVPTQIDDRRIINPVQKERVVDLR